MKVAILLTCHNRRETTLECLRRLFKCNLLEGIAFDVWLTEDGSTDGTGLAVTKLFPKVKLIQGAGNDFWCGGMRRAWNAAAAHCDYDGYLWLNDDTMLREDALATLMVTKEGIVVGATYDLDSAELTYSGRDSEGKLIHPNGELQPCIMMNGNAVYVSRAAYKVLGNFPKYFTHSLGDYDYARRAVEHGIPVWVTPKYVGTCENKKPKAIWTDPAQPLFKRLKDLYSPLSGVQPRIFFRYNWYHDGLCQAMRLWMSQHLRVFFPRLWR